MKENDESAMERMVEVVAQVMEYDESVGGCGGWIPLDGGGMSVVSLEQYVKPLDVAKSPPDAIVVIDETKEPTPAEIPMKYEYVIRGRRIDDHKTLLLCTVCKDTSYRLMSPYLHTCTMGAKRFGLCFKSSYEACLFQKQLQKAIEHLYSQSKSSSGESYGDSEELDDEVFVPVELPVSRESSDSSSAAGASVAAVTVRGTSGVQWPSVGVDVLQPSVHLAGVSGVDVVLHRSATGSSATYPYVYFSKAPPTKPAVGSSSGGDYNYPSLPPSASGGAVSPASSFQQRPAVHQYSGARQSAGFSPAAQGSRRANELTRASVSMSSFAGANRSSMIAADPLSTTSVGASSFGSFRPSNYGSAPGGRRRDSAGSAKASSRLCSSTYQPSEVLLPLRKKGCSLDKNDKIVERAQCFYCSRRYRTDQNERGACDAAPDVCELWLERLTCLWCANCAVYCCLRTDDTGFGAPARGVCSCVRAPGESRERCCARWTLLGILSLVIPCLWCYVPIKGCLMCCRACGVCGARHRPID